MSFGQPNFLWGLWLIPLLIIFDIVTTRFKRRALERVGDARLIAALSARTSRGKQRVKTWLIIAGIFFVVIALARPQWGTHVELVQQQGIEIMVVLDTSTSMIAEDIPPNRLERAKLEIEELIDRLAGVQIGLVVFSGASFVQFPTTSDVDAAKLFLRSAEAGMVSQPGTAIGDAIRTAMHSFNTKELKYKTIILLTDGEDHDTDPIGAARAAAEEGITIFPIGFGSAQGEPIPVHNEQGEVIGFKQDKNGQTVLSHLDERTLQEMARITGGQYFRATASGAEIDEIARRLEELDRKELEEKLLVQRVERYQLPVALALVALVGDLLLTDRRENRVRTYASSE